MSEFAGLSVFSLGLLAQVALLRPYLRNRLIADALGQEQLSAEERKQAFSSFAKERRIANAEQLETFRQAQVLTSEALTALIERPVRLRRHCERLYRPKAEARFLDRKTQLDRVVYSLIRLKDEGMAQELYLRLDEGEANFSDLAAEYSEGPERNTRGVVGPAPLANAHPLLAERLRTASAGMVQEPFRIEQWWLVFRLESFTPATFDDVMAEQMSQELFEEWLEAEVAIQLTTLRPLLLDIDEEQPG